DFRNNKLSNYRLEGTFLSKKVEVRGNSAAVTATARGTAMTGTITLKVDSLATSATNHSEDVRNSLKAGVEEFNIARPLSEQLQNFAAGEIKINGHKVNI